MPLHSLRESLGTLSALVRQSRKLRAQEGTRPDDLVKLDVMTDETIETMRTLVDILFDAHQRGDLDAMLKVDREDE